MELSSVVAGNVRRIREQRKLTLDAAAELTGVSRSMLAQIEKGDVNPTLSVLWKIANGFKVSFSMLIDAPGETVALVRGEGVSPIESDDGRYLNYPVFVFDEKRLFESYRIVIKPEGSLEAKSHMLGTEEFITVFAGELEICVGQECYALRCGDSIRFTANTEHSYRNTGSTDVQLSMVLYYNKV